MATKTKNDSGKKESPKKTTVKNDSGKKGPVKPMPIAPRPAAKKAAAKPAAKKAAAKKPAAKKAAAKKPAAKRTPNAAFMKALTPSPILAAVIGAAPLARTEATKKIWDYIKKHNLQDSANRRNINADDKLRPLFGKAQISMFELTKLVSANLKDA